MRPLILVDGMSLVFRAYHALLRTGMKNSDGEPTFAVFAFVNILTSLLEKYDPEAIAVVFDTKEPTFRHEMYAEYKAHRDAFPEDLVPQLGRIKEAIQLMGLEQVELPGWEADDIIGTIARREAANGREVLCLTSDKDYFQLVDDHVKILRPGKDVAQYDVFDAERVKEKFGVKPDHVIDVLALIGDSSDNVPGVKGVGEKTAIPLIEKYGTVENLYEHLDEIERESVRKKFIEHRDMAFLSKKLVTIALDVPVNHVREHLHRKPIRFADIDAFFGTMGFHQIRNKYKKMSEGSEEAGAPIDPSVSLTTSADAPPPSHLQRLADVEHSYELVHTTGGFESMMQELAGCTLLSVDLETTGLDAMSCRIVGIALCAREGRAFYVAVDDRDASDPGGLFTAEDIKHAELLPITPVLDALRPMLEDPAIGKCGQNLKFDALIFRRYNIRVTPIAFDTMLADYLLDPDLPHNLDALASRWLEYEPISITTLIGEKRASQLNMAEVDPARVADYAAEDADVALKLRNKLAPALEREGLMDLATNIEFKAEEVLIDMEYNGIAINTAALGELAVFMRDEAVRLEKEIWKEAGQEFVISSPKQLGEVLFEKLMLPATKKTKTGYSTDASVLTELSEMYPIAQMILDYRQVEKLRSTYVESLPRLINARTGRVHTTYNMTVAATGRLSSTDPNLQNIPVRSELGRQIRKAFVPQHKNAHIFSADYSQIELRIMASISQDPGLLAAFSSGADVHKATAATLFDVPIDDVTSDQRRVAKTVNFGIMYGQGAFGLAQQLGISRTEGQQIIDNYFSKYGGIKHYIDSTIESTRLNGYAETLCKRRRHFPLINANNRGLRTAAERAAVNMPIQGTAADMMKLAMIRVHARMQELGLRSLLMLQVHDELVFEVFDDEVDVLRTMVTHEMEHALPLEGVPVIVDTGIGSSWYEAH